MNRDALLKLLQEVAGGALSAEVASERLQHLACEDIGFAHIDHHRKSDRSHVVL